MLIRISLEEPCWKVGKCNHSVFLHSIVFLCRSPKHCIWTLVLAASCKPQHLIKSYCSLKSSDVTEGRSLDLAADTLVNVKPAHSWSTGLISVNVKKNTVFGPHFIPASISLKASLPTNHYLCFESQVTRHQTDKVINQTNTVRPVYYISWR